MSSTEKPDRRRKLPGYKSKRTVYLLDCEPHGKPTALFGYGFTTIARRAGVTVLAVIRAWERGSLDATDVLSVADYIRRHDKRRRPGRVGERKKRESGKVIKARIFGASRGGNGPDRVVEDLPEKGGD